MGEVSWSANRRGQYTRYKKKHMSKFASFAAVARQDCRRQNAKFKMILYLVLLSVTFSKQEQSIFQADASDKVKLGFVNQNQEHRADFSKMVVDWEPRAIMMDVTLLGDLDKQVVEGREEEEDEWQRVDNAPKQRAGLFRVRSTMAQPCRPHWVRILIPTTDGSLEVYEHPRPLPAATREQLTTYQRKFVPSPRVLHLCLGTRPLVLSYMRSTLATGRKPPTTPKFFWTISTHAQTMRSQCQQFLATKEVRRLSAT